MTIVDPAVISRIAHDAARKARNDALEEAAQIAEFTARTDHAGNDYDRMVMRDCCEFIARYIRALKDEK